MPQGLGHATCRPVESWQSTECCCCCCPTDETVVVVVLQSTAVRWVNGGDMVDCGASSDPSDVSTEHEAAVAVVAAAAGVAAS